MSDTNENVIQIPAERYEQLLDAETRLDVIIDIVKSVLDEYGSDFKKTILRIAGQSSFVDKYEEAIKEE